MTSNLWGKLLDMKHVSERVNNDDHGILLGISNSICFVSSTIIDNPLGLMYESNNVKVRFQSNSSRQQWQASLRRREDTYSCSSSSE